MLAALLLAAVEELSTIAVPIRATIAPLVPQIEARVPKTFRNTIPEKRYTVSYDVVRDPVSLKMAPTGLFATTVARYSLRACAAPLPCVSCGIGEPKRHAILSVHTQFSGDPSWRLKSVTTAFPPRFPNRCRVTLLNIDITDRYIAPIIDAQLRDVGRTIDRNTPDLTNMRPMAQDVWSALQSPLELAPRTWLLFEPQQVALGPIQGQGLQVTGTLALTARTSVVVGQKPVAALRPLPALRNAGQVAGGLKIPFDVSLPYEEASRLATEEFGRRRYKTGGADLRIESIRITAARNGRVTVETDVDYRRGRLRRYTGPVVLEGTPRIDTKTNSIVVPDLDYTLDRQGRSFLAVRVGERLAHDSIRARMRESAKWPLAPHVMTIRAELTRALSRELAPGVTMRGTVTAVEPRDVVARDTGIVVSVTITGTAEVNATGRLGLGP